MYLSGLPEGPLASLCASIPTLVAVPTVGSSLVRRWSESPIFSLFEAKCLHQGVLPLTFSAPSYPPVSLAKDLLQHCQCGVTVWPKAWKDVISSNSFYISPEKLNPSC